jgi:predicted ferric reductase
MSAVSKVSAAVGGVILYFVVIPLTIMWMLFFWVPREAFRWIRRRVSLALADVVGLPKSVINVVSLIIFLNAFALGIALLALVGVALNVLGDISEWLSGSITHPLLLILIFAGVSGTTWLYHAFRGRLEAWTNRPR